MLVAAFGCQFVGAMPARAQSTAPSSITPRSLRPIPTGGDATTVAAPSDGLTPPPGAETLSVKLSTLEVEGGFPEVASEVQAIAAPLAHRTVTLAQIYAAASAIEAAHIRAGYVLARVVVPPQTLRPDGPVRIVVIDGFFERIDASGLPRRVRSRALGRAASLQQRRHLSLAQIEQPLVLAGDLPGLTLTSTLAPGVETGGAVLLLTGDQRAVGGSISAGNFFSGALGRYGVTAQLSLNSLLGQGEQIYAFATSGYDLARAFDSDAPVRVLGGGAVIATGNGRASLNPEVTFSRTQPLREPGVLRTRGELRRLSLRGGYTLQRTRKHSLTLGATIEQIRESNVAIDFATRLSLDRFAVGRIEASYAKGFAGDGGIALSAEVSQGLGGIDARGGAAAAPPSRQGAGPHFTKLAATLRVQEPVPHGFRLTVFAKGQTSFGAALFRSEQSQLEGADALSAYVGGITAVDESATIRAELGHPYTLSGSHFPAHLMPYAFAAAGRGWIDRPTAVESASLNLTSVGAGIRCDVTRAGIEFDLEYAHGSSNRAAFDHAEHLSVAVAKNF